MGTSVLVPLPRCGSLSAHHERHSRSVWRSMRVDLAILSLLAPQRGMLPRECQGCARAPVEFGAGVLGHYSICLLYLRHTCRRLTLGAFSKDPRLGAGRRVPGPPETMVAGGVVWLFDMRALPT